MKLATFRYGNDTDRVGALTSTGDSLVDLTAAAGLTSVQALIEAGETGLDLARSAVEAPNAQAKISCPSTEAILRAPIPVPPQIRDFSVFPLHIRQAPVGMQKLAARLAGRRGARHRPCRRCPGSLSASSRSTISPTASASSGRRHRLCGRRYSSFADFELELAAVLGTGGKDIPVEEAEPTSSATPSSTTSRPATRSWWRCRECLVPRRARASTPAMRWALIWSPATKSRTRVFARHGARQWGDLGQRHSRGDAAYICRHDRLCVAGRDPLSRAKSWDREPSAMAAGWNRIAISRTVTWWNSRSSRSASCAIGLHCGRNGHSARSTAPFCLDGAICEFANHAARSRTLGLREGFQRRNRQNAKRCWDI